MNVLVINSGSSSVKYQLFDLDTEKAIVEGQVERIGLEESAHTVIRNGQKRMNQIEAPDHRAAIRLALDALMNEGDAQVGAVAHRIGHGGSRYRGPVVIDDAVKDEIKRLIPLMPLHHPAMLAGVEACQAAMPGVPHVAVFDTAFHNTIPEEAYVYGLPYELCAEKGIRKFGFHGNSHEYAANRAAAFLETPLRRLNIITCHLGSGASVCAVQRGVSVDTSMGFTPMQGLIMGTRVGDLDPGIITYLARNEGMTVDDIDSMLNKKSGLLGISGTTPDMRDLLDAADKGERRALLAIKAFCYRIKCYIGAYMAAMGGADVIVFTGGIGQNSRGIRSRSLQGLERMGIAVDPVKNDRCRVDSENQVCDISAVYSRVQVLAVAANEELMIARQCARAIEYKRSIKRDIMSSDRRPIRVAVSAHHAHLSRHDIDALFGTGHQLTKRAPLYIDSEFVCEEKINLIGPRGRIDGVRILGPERARTQVEISRTEEFKLGIDAPVRASGDLDNTPGLVLEGPAGTVTLPDGVICSWRHIHMTPADAETYGVRDKDIVMVKMEGDRELIFGDVLVRVKPDYKLEMHIDTDEANAAELPPVSEGFLVRIESRMEG